MQELLDWNAECIRLCDLLHDVVQAEMDALIYLQTDKLLELNARKEEALAQLAEAKQRLKIAAESVYGVTTLSEIESKLTGDDRENWQKARSAWTASWDKTRQVCEISVLFIQHSQKNLNLLSQDLKRLLGEQPTYSAKGTRVDRQSAGRVVEARY